MEYPHLQKWDGTWVIYGLHMDYKPLKWDAPPSNQLFFPTGFPAKV